VAVSTFARKGIAAFGCLLAAVALAGCGEAAVGSGTATTHSTSAATGHGTSATDPTGGATTSTGPAADGSATKSATGGAPTVTPATGTSPGTAKEVADPLEADSYPAPASVKHASAATPSKASAAIVAAGAPSNAEIRSELAQMKAVERSARKTQRLNLTPVPGGESIGGNGTIPIPTDVPEPVQKVIAGANEIADFPYVYGGGHASFVDNAYDCSGSVSYALAAGGLLSAPETSGQLESWGAPGPGKFITVYANAGHTYMYVDGILFDTAGRRGVYASRWQVEPTDNEGYVVRHWPGL
jgi:cell wall-associated NlpC family hydrolase